MIEPNLGSESVREVTSFVCKFEIPVIDMNMIRGSDRELFYIISTKVLEEKRLKTTINVSLCSIYCVQIITEKKYIMRWIILPMKKSSRRRRIQKSAEERSFNNMRGVSPRDLKINIRMNRSTAWECLLSPSSLLPVL